MGEGTRVGEYADNAEFKKLQEKVDNFIRQFEVFKASMQPYGTWGGWPPNEKYRLDNKCDSGYDWAETFKNLKVKESNE